MIHYVKSFRMRIGLFISILLLVGSCATQLAPSYDKVVVDGLNSTNTASMTLFASLATGTKPGDFGKRADKYSELIGKLDSLAILAASRPVPKNHVTDAINNALSKRGVAPVVDDGSTPPSAHAIRKISETIAKMRDTDMKQGVTATEVMAFKGQSAIYFDQAITYENFLLR